MSALPITSVFNDGYVAEAYETYRRDPSAVEESWRQFFRFAESLSGGAPAAAVGTDARLLRKAAGAAALAAAIREYGHLAVALDPLGTPAPGAPELTPEFHGITAADLAEVPAAALEGVTTIDHGGRTAADVIAVLQERYCGGIAFEFEHLGEEAERAWFRHAVESGEHIPAITADEKRKLLERMTQVDGMERFIGRAFVNAKRFSIEGVDALVPMIDEALAGSGKAGTTAAVIGMAHRGRLNVLAHALQKPYARIFREFAGQHDQTNSASGTGDVKYHLGYRTTREFDNGARVETLLVPNPSHLEFVNAVLMGVSRAMQRTPSGRDENRVLPIAVHGDAAFPGEGVVTETLNLSLLRGYRVGGTLHFIANNQVGFTTDPSDSRSTHYASDPAKGFDVPVMHVNADDLESCIHAVRIAVAYRQRFAKDILIDIVGYRRHGHNEADQPAFTQPTLYDVIRTHPTPREVWAARLVRERVVTEEDVAAIDRRFAERLQAEHDQAQQAGGDRSHTDDAKAPATPAAVETAVRAEELASLNERLLVWPEGFSLHATLQRTLPRRREALTAKGIDWGHAEALAFAALLVEGTNVRITGQDAERGTFSHRQAVLHDVKTGATFTPLGALKQDGAGVFEIYNSPLSETAVMAFEYGFSTAAPRDLVLWEAQFGDFANVAAPIIDQFIVSDRAKWGLDNALVLLLPHGYEGQGPEHSSARLERFLQLAAEGNMVVAYPSTPAQYFHILRRHVRRAERRPLVLMQPKSLLRLPEAASALEDLAAGTFRPVIEDGLSRPEDVRRVVLCTGKVYYDLVAQRADASHVAIARVEELYPWPHEAIAAAIDRYPNVDEVVWAQEEPKNMGAWTYVSPRLKATTGNLLTVRYIGRPERASPAEGYKNTHDVEQARIVRDVLAPLPVSRKAKAGSR
jgi:2-oxoglutarate dehydrogenase E1 component